MLFTVYVWSAAIVAVTLMLRHKRTQARFDRSVAAFPPQMALAAALAAVVFAVALTFMPGLNTLVAWVALRSWWNRKVAH